MSFPEFYHPHQVGQLYIPKTGQAVDEGHKLALPTSDTDKQRIALLLVDIQVDFVHSDGALSVPGAIDDTRRVIEWLFRNTDRVTTIAASLDSHMPIQIFSPAWWEDKDGQHPDPYTVIKSHDTRTGRWRALYEPEWSANYVQQLEQQAKKELMIWPYHTLIGTPGHDLVPSLRLS